jgi:hypothetical protein
MPLIGSLCNVSQRIQAEEAVHVISIQTNHLKVLSLQWHNIMKTCSKLLYVHLYDGPIMSNILFHYFHSIQQLTLPLCLLISPYSTVIMRNNNICFISFPTPGLFSSSLSLCFFGSSMLTFFLKEQSLINEKFIHISQFALPENCYIFC